MCIFLAAGVAIARRVGLLMMACCKCKLCNYYFAQCSEAVRFAGQQPVVRRHVQRCGVQIAVVRAR